MSLELHVVRRLGWAELESSRKWGSESGQAGPFGTPRDGIHRILLERQGGGLAAESGN